ncbi:MAG TPA: STAS domain-containing protein [Solirubrobacterales bacterium]|nr:STAS domain-containing protein [Solirubrobacterales bacterium]
MTISLQVEVEVRDGVAFVTAAGEVDLSNADRLSAALGSSPCSTADGVVLDLRKVPFMDSSGLAAILHCAREIDPPVTIVVGEGSPVAKLFDLANIGAQVPTFTDPAAAEAEARGATDVAG